ncbi:quinone oxidoreductase family protein [Lysinibacillus sp. NPDC097195]|uniref:quinone oxidoreductase family protein n=1 Tax=Lysinibacillus sp. NPDC097195 TaxID=3364141 RepID=UPI0038151399
MKALVFETFGGPEVLQYKEIADPIMTDDEILVRMKAVGLNFADIYRRKGNYHLVGQPPFILGYEGAGVVEKVGANIHNIQVGDRIAFADVPFANAELVVVPRDKVIVLPAEISFETAATILLQGLTAQYLVTDSYAIQPGDTVLIHAAAGGVGQNLIQMAKLKGANVIGITSTKEKAQAASHIGADQVFLYEEQWVQKVKEITDGLGVDVVYESVGATLQDSFEATKIGGTVVFFGMSGGDPEPINPRMLMDTSKTLTGGDLWNVLTSFEERKIRSQQLFDWLTEGMITIQQPTIFALEDGAKAHALLESRKSIGKIVLQP